MEHLSFEDMERYLTEDDSSDEYLCWLEPVMEHLTVCKYCATEVNRLMILSEIFGEEQSFFSLIDKEQETRRKYVAAKLELLAMNNMAKRLRQGEVLQYFLQAEQLKRKKGVMRGNHKKEDGLEECAKDIVTSYEDGRLIVEVPCERGLDVTVVLVSLENGREPMIAKASWSSEKNIAVAEFVMTELEATKETKQYEIYIDIE